MLKMKPKEIKKLLTSHNLGRLATVNEKCRPHVVPVAYFYFPAFDESGIYFHTSADATKARNIEANQNVSFTVDEYISTPTVKVEMGVKIDGEAKVLSREEMENFVNVLRKMYPSDRHGSESGGQSSQRAAFYKIAFGSLDKVKSWKYMAFLGRDYVSEKVGDLSARA
jgi:nitroimidazol reductase NimA-like FMN-containing flavoprotein (pyridoxamine 5'-phosphate oxidase superfamily)